MQFAGDHRAGEEKFPELTFEKFPQQLQWKMHRAKEHFQELEKQVGAYMNVEPSGPGKMVPAPGSTPEKPMYIYGTPEPMPPRFGLIAGDYLQNLRSVLDYLVWQLIDANGKIPHETKTAFPICKSRKSFDEAKLHHLVGVPDEALAIIEAMMPYPERRPSAKQPHTIHILDELTNENKHRRVLFTKISSIFKPDEPVPFPSMELEITRFQGGQVIPGERLLAYIAFKGGIVKNFEVTTVLIALMEWMGYDILPQFEKFFSDGAIQIAFP